MVVLNTPSSVMEPATSTLILVAHPVDETLGFSSVCARADVVSVTDGSGGGCIAARADEFQQACERMGARRPLLLNLPGIFPWRLPMEVLFEPVDGRDSLLIARRPGTQIRLWRPV